MYVYFVIKNFMKTFLAGWGIISTLFEIVNCFIDLFSLINKRKNKIPARLINILQFFLQIILLPIRILLYWLSYLSDLCIKKKCWIKITSQSNEKYSWVLLDNKYEELLSFNKTFETHFQCLNNAKSVLWIRFFTHHKKENKFDFYCIYISKNDYDWFYELKHERSKVKINDQYILMASKWILK